jgi:hypothetical protein
MRKWQVLAGAAGAAVALAGVGAATTSHSGQQGVIHGCAQVNSGRLRVVESGEACRRSERGALVERDRPSR